MRPLGIVILSVLTLILGSLLLVGGLLLAAASGVIAATPRASEEIARTMSRFPGVPIPVHSMIAAGIILTVIGISIFVGGVIMLLIGWGLWTGQNWARWVAIIVFGLGALSNLSSLLQGEFGSIISLVINGLVVYYFFTPHVKRFFKATL